MGKTEQENGLKEALDKYHSAGEPKVVKSIKVLLQRRTQEARDAGVVSPSNRLLVGVWGEEGLPADSDDVIFAKFTTFPTEAIALMADGQLSRLEFVRDLAGQVYKGRIMGEARSADYLKQGHFFIRHLGALIKNKQTNPVPA